MALLGTVWVGGSLGGVVVSVLEERGPWAIGSWLAMAILFAAGWGLMLASRHRTLENLAQSQAPASGTFYLFSHGAYSPHPGHEAWLLSPDSALGDGFVTVSGDVLHIWLRRDDRPPIEIARHEIISIEQVQVWGSRVFRSQILVRLVGGGQLAVTPVRPGFADLMGLSVKRVDEMVRDLKSRLG
jgi:hypothetical protein